MNARGLGLCLSVWSAVLAGCAETPVAGPTDHVTTSTHPPVSTSTWDIPPLEESIDGTRRLALDGCTGMTTWAFFPGNGPGAPPDGCEPTQEGASSVLYHMMRCQHVGWGPFERGPVHLIWESHTNGDYPVRCEEGTWNRRAVLAQVWLDDPELAGWLGDTFGLTTVLADFRVSEGNMTPAGTYRTEWRFAAEDSPESRMTVGEAIEFDAFPEEVISRVAWSANATWYILDLLGSYWYSNGAVPIATGNLEPPALYAAAHPTSTYTSEGVAYWKGPVTGTLRAYGDAECTSPL